MAQFRKKPVVIEARQLTPDTAGEIVAWLAEYGVMAKSWSRPPMRALSGLLIPTLESPHEASWGDWIIRGVKGEFYPCKPDIFAETYQDEKDSPVASLGGTDRGFMPKFALGDRVRKRSGSSWQGLVVGFYTTALTPNGYAVESEREPGSVQIYPEAALENADV